jgi:hypothetical protein
MSAQMIVFVLICVCLILAGAAIGRPLGWVIIGIALVAFLLTVGGANFSIGK